jgi:hypothetical protein
MEISLNPKPDNIIKINHMKNFIIIGLLLITFSVTGQTVVILELPDNCNVSTNIREPLFEQNNSILKIYPNPNNGTFYLHAEFTTPIKKATINISDVTGHVLFTETVYCNSRILIKQLAVRDIPGGTYVIELISDKESVSGKLLISN